MAVVFVMLSKDSYKSSGGIIIKVKRGNYATYGTPWVVFFFGFHVIAVGAGISSPKVIGSFEMSINTAYTDIEICRILQLS